MATSSYLVAPGSTPRTRPASRRPARRKQAARRRNRGPVMVLVVLALLVTVGTAGGYGLGRAVDAVREWWPEAPPQLASDKVAPPDPIDLSGPADTCLPESLSVRLDADAATVEKGEPVTFTVRVTNVGRVPCLVDGSDASRMVTITDATGKDRVWSSADCAKGETMLLLGPGDPWVRDVRWSSVRTVEGCKGGQPGVAPGDYEARVTLDDVPGVTSNVVGFTVEAPPEPSVSPSASASPSQAASPSPSPSSEQKSRTPPGKDVADEKKGDKGGGKKDG